MVEKIIERLNQIIDSTEKPHDFQLIESEIKHAVFVIQSSD
jgi:hypothetical protein